MYEYCTVLSAFEIFKKGVAMILCGFLTQALFLYFLFSKLEKQSRAFCHIYIRDRCFNIPSQQDMDSK